MGYTETKYYDYLLRYALTCIKGIVRIALRIRYIYCFCLPNLPAEMNTWIFAKVNVTYINKGEDISLFYKSRLLNQCQRSGASVPEVYGYEAFTNEDISLRACHRYT